VRTSPSPPGSGRSPGIAVLATATLLRRVEAALHQAEQDGRDRVVNAVTGE
jgi:hypothetical protein